MPTEGYFSADMMATSGQDGVVWETEIHIPPGGSIYYYFEVMLAEPVSFTTLDREAIADMLAMDPTTVSLADILSDDVIHSIEISGWAMPGSQEPSNRGSWYYC